MLWGFIKTVSTTLETEIVLVFCSLMLSSLGFFLVLKRKSLIVDAISHSVLLGNVVAFLIVKELGSPFLMVGAFVVGIIVVYLSDFISKQPRVSKDSAIGIVFAFFFSLSVIIISTSIKKVHMDADVVFIGNPEFAYIGQLYKIIPILLLNVFFVIFFYKELKIFIFDPVLANILGFSSVLINFVLMLLLSVATVAALDIAGIIMTIVCIIGPPSIAILLTKKTFKCWLLSLWISYICTVFGCLIGNYLDIPISGSISILILVVFLIVLFLEPKKGIVTKVITNYFQKKYFMMIILLMHLENHFLENNKNYIEEVRSDLKWSIQKYNSCLNKAIKLGYIELQKKELFLTNLGRKYLKQKNENFGISIN